MLLVGGTVKIYENCELYIKQLFSPSLRRSISENLSRRIVIRVIYSPTTFYELYLKFQHTTVVRQRDCSNTHEPILFDNLYRRFEFFPLLSNANEL